MPKIAAIQMCSTDKVQENLAIAEKLIAEAAEQGAALVVLPEMFSIMSAKATDKVKLKEQFGEGKVQNFLLQQAKKNNIWLVGGTVPISCDDPHKVRAACIVYDAQGKVAARYDKMHLFDVVLSETEFYKESDTTEAGEAKVIVVDTPIGKLGLAVCYDIRFSMLFNRLFRAGAEIIAIPAAFTVKTGAAHWQLLTRSRAVENFCYVVGACQGGTHAGERQTYGHSLIIEPWGTVLAERLETTPGVVCADIDLEHLHKIRKSIPVGDHQRFGQRDGLFSNQG